MTSTPTPPATTEPMTDDEIVEIKTLIDLVGPEIGKPSVDRITLIYALLEKAPRLLTELSRHRQAAKSHEERANKATEIISHFISFGGDDEATFINISGYLKSEFAAVASAQREADAKIADRKANEDYGGSEWEGGFHTAAREIAAAIRKETSP